MKQIDMIQPTVMAEPLAANGPRNTIPAEATGTEYASVNTGFPEITMKAIKDGGLPPRGEDCNGMFYISTDQKVFLQNGGVITFSEKVSNAIGGYPQNAILDYIDSYNTYHKVQSLIDDNTYNFITNPEYINGEYWKEISLGGGGGLEIGDIGFTQMAIDETKGKRRILNGQLIIQDQYVQFTNIIKNSVALNPDLACTESEWQTELTMSPNGICYKYVIDDEAGTIRLPKYPAYLDLSVNGAKTVDVFGTGNALGLTDGSTNAGLKSTNGSTTSAMVSLYQKAIGTVASGSGLAGDKALGVVNNASGSGLTGSVTTTSEQIKGTYFIQVATGAEIEDSITNELELINPFSLLDYKFSEYELNNSSWLLSEGQYNYKTVYPAVYDLLLKIYNGTETKAGVSVKLTTETFTDYDFVLNTDDETFRLPIKVKLASGKAVGGTEYGLRIQTIQNGNVINGYLIDTASHEGNYIDGYITNDILRTDTPITGSNNDGMGDLLAIGVHPDATTSGLETSDSGLYLYFYVGEVAQNANLVNVGRIQETYTTKSMVDGRWVGGNYTIASNLSFAANKSVTYDLSSYLPSDGYTYEVLFSLQAQTGSTSGYAVNLSLETDITPGFIIAKAVTRAGASISCVGSTTVPVGTARQVTLKQWASYPCDIISFDAVGYRRIGTNL